MNRLDKAIEDFEDENSTLTLGERIAGLGEALMWNSFESIKMVNKHGSKSEINEEEEYKQEKCMKLFKELEKMYLSKLKSNKIEGKSDDNLHREWIQKMKQSQGSLGSIVVEQKTNRNEQ